MERINAHVYNKALASMTEVHVFEKCHLFEIIWKEYERICDKPAEKYHKIDTSILIDTSYLTTTKADLVISVV